ncbi:homeodomain transcription factor [Lithospermum erythrorhizon]|uniref:RING-type E3 ubiquitin transferase n=1 Tax=Lithospermum erythrorhizon TaxID=34254 RepID=A0AAV3QPD1_LITER
MKFMSFVGNSFGCSASGERLLSAARDGDLQEAKALLEYNPRLARYSNVGVRNSPLHYSAAHGHHEIVSLLIDSRVNINLRNYSGQTALMQACQYGHWEVVQTLILFNANIHRVDCLNGGTALHLAALNGHPRCIRLLLADYIPSIPNFWNIMQKRYKNEKSVADFYKCALREVINRPADGGITALHMAALNRHSETVQLLLDLGASVIEVTIDDGTTFDLMGAGSTPLHYAACGGNAQCCQLLVAKGASLTMENANGWTPLMVAHPWHRNSLEEILTSQPESQQRVLPSPYLCLPLMSVVKIARECGWRSNDVLHVCKYPCVVCLERKCSVSAEGCAHEFCTICALYLCSMSSSTSVSHGPPGSIACPLCRHGIVAFVNLPDTRPIMKAVARNSFSFSSCTFTPADDADQNSLKTPLCKPDSVRISPHGSSFLSLSLGFQRLSEKFRPGLCIGSPDCIPCRVPQGDYCELRSNIDRCSRSLQRSTSQTEGRKWFCSFRSSVETESSC